MILNMEYYRVTYILFIQNKLIELQIYKYLNKSLCIGSHFQSHH